MEFLFKLEPQNKEELKELLLKKNILIDDYKIAVILIATDKNKNILLQRRGPKARDEKFKLENIGGGLEPDDLDFKSALRREIKEEVGEEAKFFIDYFLGCFLDNHKWLFLVYKGHYSEGELKIMEPGKALGYEFFKLQDLPQDELSEGCFSLFKYYKQTLEEA